MSDWRKDRTDDQKRAFARKAEKEFLSLKVGDILVAPSGTYWIVARNMKPALYGEFKDTKYIVPTKYMDSLDDAFKNECGLRIDAYWYGNEGYKKDKEHVKAKTDKSVEVWLYGSKKVYPSADEAKMDMKEAMSWCDPGCSEYQRYAEVYFAIEDNPTGKIFTDSDEFMKTIIKDPKERLEQGGKTTSDKEDLVKGEKGQEKE